MDIKQKIEQINYILRSWILSGTERDYYIGVRDGLESALNLEC